MFQKSCIDLKGSTENYSSWESDLGIDGDTNETKHQNTAIQFNETENWEKS